MTYKYMCCPTNLHLAVLVVPSPDLSLHTFKSVHGDLSLVSAPAILPWSAPDLFPGDPPLIRSLVCPPPTRCPPATRPWMVHSPATHLWCIPQPGGHPSLVSPLATRLWSDPWQPILGPSPGNPPLVRPPATRPWSVPWQPALGPSPGHPALVHPRVTRPRSAPSLSRQTPIELPPIRPVLGLPCAHLSPPEPSHTTEGVTLQRPNFKGICSLPPLPPFALFFGGLFLGDSD